MNKLDNTIQRLFACAAQAEAVPLPAPHPGFATLVLANLAERSNYLPLMLCRRGLLCACFIALLSACAAYYELSAPSNPEIEIANAALQSGMLP